MRVLRATVDGEAFLYASCPFKGLSPMTREATAANHVLAAISAAAKGLRGRVAAGSLALSEAPRDLPACRAKGPRPSFCQDARCGDGGFKTSNKSGGPPIGSKDSRPTLAENFSARFSTIGNEKFFFPNHRQYSSKTPI